MTQQEVNGLLERPKPNIEAANIEVRDRLDAANKRIAELESANERIYNILRNGEYLTDSYVDWMEEYERNKKANGGANT